MSMMEIVYFRRHLIKVDAESHNLRVLSECGIEDDGLRGEGNKLPLRTLASPVCCVLFCFLSLGRGWEFPYPLTVF